MAVIPTRLERTLLGWGTSPLCSSWVLGAMAWVGWATGSQALTCVHPGLAADDAVDGSAGWRLWRRRS